MSGHDSFYVLYAIFWATILFNIHVTLSTYLACDTVCALACTFYKSIYPDAESTFAMTAAEIVLRVNKWGLASLCHRMVWVSLMSLEHKHVFGRAAARINEWRWYSGFWHGYPWLANVIVLAWDTRAMWFNPAVELLHAYVFGPIHQSFWKLYGAVQALETWVQDNAIVAWHQTCGAIHAIQRRLGTHVATSLLNDFRLARDHGVRLTLSTAMMIGCVLNDVREAPASTCRSIRDRFDAHVATPCRNVNSLARNYGVSIVLCTAIVIERMFSYVHEATASAFWNVLRLARDYGVCITLYTAMTIACVFNHVHDATVSAFRTSWAFTIDLGQIEVKCKFPTFMFSHGQAGREL
jgi:hypothetical protein